MKQPASFGGRGPLIDSPHYVYVLACGNGSHYIGCTVDIEDRMRRHTHGQVIATKDRLPVRLELYTVFSDKYKAFAFEKYLKSGSGRAFSLLHFYSEA